MKRIISAILMVCMIATMFVIPMVHTAADEPAAWTIPTTFANTNELYSDDSDAVTAVKVPDGATITVDGKADDAAWANAVALKLDTDAKTANGYTYSDRLNAEYYVMWDETSLYILEKRTEDRLKLSSGANFWSNGHMTFYGVCLPTTVTSEKPGTAPLVGTWITSTDVGATGDAYNYFRGQIYGWNDAESKSNSASGRARTYDKVTGIESKFEVVEGGYVIETKIDWTAVSYGNADAFVPAADVEIGVDFIFCGYDYNKSFFPNRAVPAEGGNADGGDARMFNKVKLATEAPAWTIPTTFGNTKELFTPDAETFNAVKLPEGATVTVDGKMDEAFWAGAEVIEFNSEVKAAKNHTYSDMLDAKYYVMWDETSLYILEKRVEGRITVTSSSQANFWSNSHKTFYDLCLPTVATAEKPGASALIGTWVTDATAGATGDAYNYCRYNCFGWNETALKSNSAADRSRETDKKTGIESKFTITEDGYIIETKIDWATLGLKNADTFVPAEDAEFGLSFYFCGYNYNKNFYPNRAALEENAESFDGGDSRMFGTIRLGGEAPVDEDASSEDASSEEASSEDASSEEASSVEDPTDEPTAEPTDEPTAEPTDEATEPKSDDSKTEDKGCASVAGGAIVALLALAAAPMVCRKKED